MNLRLSLCLLLIGCGTQTASLSAAPPLTADTRHAAVVTPSLNARIFQPATGRDVSANEMLADLARAPLVLFGERHNTPPVQALELWLLKVMLAQNPSLNVAMEHFDRDVQTVLDAYLAGTIDEAAFLAQSRPWPGYAEAWAPLVETVKRAKRSLIALNVPKPVLNGIYAQFPTMPLAAVATLPADLLAWLPPLPLAPWTQEYAAHFAASFDYEAHQLGLDEAAALAFFTELAHLRDTTMADRLVKYLHESNEQALGFFGEWHVQGGLATPSHVSAERRIITTLPEDALTETTRFQVQGRWIADYVIIYPIE